MRHAGVFNLLIFSWLGGVVGFVMLISPLADFFPLEITAVENANNG
jgi:hypothetical protein